MAKPPQIKTMNGVDVVFPVDEQGGGTWIASSKYYTLCLLNGGIEKHISSPPYRHSRGLVILDFFKFHDISAFIKKYDFNFLEPFTLIVKDHTLGSLYEIIYDGSELHCTTLEALVPKIWSSTTLYAPDQRKQREIWFNHWISSRDHFVQEEIIEFHKRQGSHEEEIKINRKEELYTVSLSNVFKSSGKKIAFYYEDFLQHTKHSLYVVNE